MSSSTQDYHEKFERISDITTYRLLREEEQEFIRIKAKELRFTQQELQIVSEMALDRQRWKEPSLSGNWPNIKVGENAVQAKKVILSKVRESQAGLRSKVKSYNAFSGKDKPKTLKPVLKSSDKPSLGLGMCPVASPRTRCCNLMTLDAVEKCGFDCSYCSIQSFYHGNEVVFDGGFADKLARLQLDPEKTYHIGTGQSSDSLMWGNHEGVLEALCEFASSNPNVVLELKTKSKNIGWLVKNPVPRNVICTWSLNPQTIIDHEEHLSASLEQRIDSARTLADRGIIVGFHFHPIIHYQGWESDYAQICETVVDQFQPDQVAMVSMGTLTFTKSVMKTIRNRDLSSKILQMPLQQSAGKLSYPMDIKLDLFKRVYGGLQAWHDKVFFYLCMEPESLWPEVFGYDYESNDQFEAAMKHAYFTKIHGNLTINQNTV